MSSPILLSPTCKERAPSALPMEDSLRMCRYCFCTEGEQVHQDEELDEFVSPCLCRGSGRSVHLGCLVQCFEAHGDWHNFKCPTCKQTYEGKALRHLAQISVAEVTKEQGEKSLQMASSLYYLAQSQSHLGDFKESKKLFEHCLIIKERHFGKNHIETATPLTELATVCGRLGDVRYQKELLERSLDIIERQNGVGHISTSNTLHNLSVAYSELGDVAQEREMLERALAIKEQCFGKDHVQCAPTLANLATVYSEIGDIHKGRDILQEALTIEEKHYGPGHVETAITLNNLGMACGEIGDLQAMKNHLERSLEIKHAYYGVDHPETCLTLANIGMACSALGEPDLAKDFTHRALVACKMADSPYSSRHVTVFLRAATTHRSLGEVSKAEELTSSALHNLVELLGPASAARSLNRERNRSSRIWSGAGRQDMVRWLNLAMVTSAPSSPSFGSHSTVGSMFSPVCALLRKLFFASDVAPWLK